MIITAQRGLALPTEAADRLMPMHAVVGRTGHILQAGPTLRKLRPEGDPVGQRFLEVFELRRPRNITTAADLRRAVGTPLSLRFRSVPQTPLRGLALALDTGEDLLVNLSFGIAAVDAVGTYALTSADFPPTDLTVELLYLVEAKEAVLDESRDLNRRLQGAKLAAEQQAFTDTLTGLGNRRAMEAMLARYATAREPFALMQIDLDYFTRVNDTLGHAAGDHVLREVARILREETRSGDTIVRAGGDEFVLIFHRMTDRRALAAIADRLLERLETPIPFRGTPCRISASIGIALSGDYPASVEATEQMLIDADRALYASKKAGRARHTFVGAEAGAAAALPRPC